MFKYNRAIVMIAGLLKTVHNLDGFIIPVMVCRALIEALNPFIAIIISSMVIDNISAGDNPENIIFVAIIGVCIIFFLTLLSGWLEKLNDVHKTNCFKRYNTMIGETTMDMDFPSLESPKTQELRDKMRLDNNWGAGIYSVFFQFQPLIQGFFAIIISIIVLFPLLQESFLFNSWGIIYYILFVLVLTGVLVYFNVCKLMTHFHNLLDKASNAKDNKIGFFFVFNKGIDYKMGKDVRLYNAKQLIWSSAEATIRSSKKFSEKASTVHGMMEGTKGLAKSLIQGGAYLFVGLRALSGAVGLGEVIRYAGTIYQLSNAITTFIEHTSALYKTAERQQSTMDYFNIPKVFYHGTIPVEKRDDNEYKIEFRNVSFKYPGSDEYVIRNLSLELIVGQRMAVVGMNGSGKTTIIKLLCRLYDPTEGEITLNGVDIKKYDYSEYMNIFSVVFQDFKLFSFSLGQNIASDNDYNADKIDHCLSLSGMEERMESMNHNTPLYKDYDDDGVEVSGGEAQKIAIARALYKDAPFFILDEPTAALDPIAEYEVYSKFNDIIGNKTAIFISHRLSSCRFCHDITVLHEGQIIQRGGHDELVADESGKYFELWNAQAQYYS